MLAVHFGQNNSYEIAMDRYQARKINDVFSSFRIYLNILYMMTEVLRNFAESDDDVEKACDALKEELSTFT